MIITRLQGGMGNQMFQYAIGRALSLKYNVPLKLDKSIYDADTNLVKRTYDLSVFNIEENIAEANEVPFIYRNHIKGKLFYMIGVFLRRLFVNKGKERFFNFDSNIFSLGSDMYLDGYWQSPKYFTNIEDVIRKDFTLKNKLPSHIENLKEVIEKENSLCVHVRRGDYVGNKHHEVVGKEYYEKAIEKMKSLTMISKIYVFSDDIKWCEENMKFDAPTMFVGEEYAGQKAEGHLVLMSTCKNFIIPNSSFSWWGAWLSNNKDKKVIVPKKWFPFLIINEADIISEGWIRM
jgi:hypothetical protein